MTTPLVTRRAVLSAVPGLCLAVAGVGIARAQDKVVKVGVIQPLSGNLSP